MKELKSSLLREYFQLMHCKFAKFASFQFLDI